MTFAADGNTEAVLSMSGDGRLVLEEWLNLTLYRLHDFGRTLDYVQKKPRCFHRGFVNYD
jgi:hypothetical protein